MELSGNDRFSSSNSPAEKKIDVNWGQIAIKEWGEKYGRPVLCIHDINDNAGSFDGLIPFLPSSWRIISFDLPGHGFSSHLPMGFFYYELFFLFQIHRIQLYYGFKNISLIGHGRGGELALSYAAVYPECVSHVCVLHDNSDLWVRASTIDEDLLLEQREAVEQIVEFNSARINLSEEEAMAELLNKKSLKENSAKVLFKRTYTELEEGSGQWSSNNDFRLRYYNILTFPYTLNNLYQYITANVLFILNKHLYSEIKSNEVYELISKNANNFSCKLTEEDENHFNYPEYIASITEKYFEDN